MALAEGFRTALDVEPVSTFAIAGPYRMGTATLFNTIVSAEDDGTDFEDFMYVSILLGEVYSSTNPNAANYGQEQDLLNDERRDLFVSWLNNPDYSKTDINEKMIALSQETNGVDSTFKIEDVWNPKIVNFLRDAIAAEVKDPCDPNYEGYIVGENDKFCEVLKQNDLIEILENANYNIELCHSPGDVFVTYANMPDVSSNPFLTANIKAGGHMESILSCFSDGFLDIVSEEYLSFVPQPKHSVPDPDRSTPTSSALKFSLSYTALIVVVLLGSFISLCN